MGEEGEGGEEEGEERKREDAGVTVADMHLLSEGVPMSCVALVTVVMECSRFGELLGFVQEI